MANIEEARKLLKIVHLNMGDGTLKPIIENALRALDGDGAEEWRAIGSAAGGSWSIIDASGAVVIMGLTRELALQIVGDHNRLRALDRAASRLADRLDNSRNQPLEILHLRDDLRAALKQED